MLHLDDLYAHYRMQDMHTEAENAQLQRSARSRGDTSNTRRALRSGRRTAGQVIVQVGMTVAGAPDTGRS